jgi:hypothetical protein
MAIITNTTSTTNNATNVRQLSVTHGNDVAGFFNVSNTLKDETLEDIAAFVTENQTQFNWEETQTAKGKTQYTARVDNLVVGWYQPGDTKGEQHVGALRFSAKSNITLGMLKSKLTK